MRNIILLITLSVFGCSDSGFTSGPSFEGEAAAGKEASKANRTPEDGDHLDSPNDGDSSPKQADLERDSQVNAKQSDDHPSTGADEAIANLGDSPKDKAMATCLNKWGEVPFAKDEISRYRTMKGSATGFSSGNVKDKAQTKYPSLVLIEFSATGFSSINLELLNPNGWYCLKTSAVGFSSRNLTRHCLARVSTDQHESTGFSNAPETVIGNCKET